MHIAVAALIQKLVSLSRLQGLTTQLAALQATCLYWKHVQALGLMAAAVITIYNAVYAIAELHHC